MNEINNLENMIIFSSVVFCLFWLGLGIYLYKDIQKEKSKIKFKKDMK